MNKSFEYLLCQTTQIYCRVEWALEQGIETMLGAQLSLLLKIIKRVIINRVIINRVINS